MAAKLAVARALKTIAFEAGVHVAVRRFAVINQVRLLELGVHSHCRAMLCTRRAGWRDRAWSEARLRRLCRHALRDGSLRPQKVRRAATSSTRTLLTVRCTACTRSFVGLAWRPINESICSEIYSTGKSNLPGSRRERQLLRSFARMAPELLRHSTQPELANRFVERLRLTHRPSAHSQAAPRVQERAAAAEAAAEAAAAAAVPVGVDSLWDEEDFDDAPVEENLRKRKRGKSAAQPSMTLNEDEEEMFGGLFEGF
jgi:hypothetical protein